MSAIPPYAKRKRQGAPAKPAVAKAAIEITFRPLYAGANTVRWAIRRDNQDVLVDISVDHDHARLAAEAAYATYFAKAAKPPRR